MQTKAPSDTRILLVDDEADLLSIVTYSFQRMGYQVLTANNGREALKILESTPIDVVVTDLRMPNGDGIELLDSAKERCPETPIIFLVSGYSDLSSEEAYNKGADALFSKPFDRKTLIEAMTRLLTPPNERWTRLTDRVEVELEISLQIAGLADAIDTQVVSLGRGGMFVALKEGKYPNVNDNVSFKIVFDGATPPLEGSGVVRWVRVKSAPNFPAGCGIEFTYLSESHKRQVIEYVNARNLKAFIPNR